MAPRIQYVNRPDGTRIATCGVGKGSPPLVLVSGMYSTIELCWAIPETLANIERLAEKRRVVVTDMRGAGFSSHESVDFSLDTLLGDMEAVVDSLGAPQVDLLANLFMTLVAIAYTVKRPEKVRRLALFGAAAHGADLRMNEPLAALEPLAEIDWKLYHQCRALVNFGWTDLARRAAEIQASQFNPEALASWRDQVRHHDVSALLSLVRCATLVMYRQGQGTLDRGQEVAATIPDAQLVRIEHPGLTMAGDWESSMGIVEQFLDERLDSDTVLELPSGTAIILFADIVDSTALTERLGDAAFRDKARELDTALRTIIRENAGTPVEGKLLGDGVLAVFTSARQAIEAALACGKSGDDAGLPLHLGLHAGDVIRESDPDGRSNVYGGAVNIAARISGLSAPGEVLVSETVRSLARTSAGVEFEDRGEHALKGVGEAVRVWAVREGA